MTPVGELIQFPKLEGPRCKVCGAAIILTKDEQEKPVTREKCFCCEHTIPLPLSVPVDHCPECAGTGRVSIHVCRDKDECRRTCPKLEPCTACLGTGRRT